MKNKIIIAIIVFLLLVIVIAGFKIFIKPKLLRDVPVGERENLTREEASGESFIIDQNEDEVEKNGKAGTIAKTGVTEKKDITITSGATNDVTATPNTVADIDEEVSKAGDDKEIKGKARDLGTIDSAQDSIKLFGNFESEKEAVKAAENYGILLEYYGDGIATFQLQSWQSAEDVIQMGIDNGWPMLSINRSKQLF